jgi:acid phosphatase
MRQSKYHLRFALALAAGLAGCADDGTDKGKHGDLGQPSSPADLAQAPGADLAVAQADLAQPEDPDTGLKTKVQTIVFIYAENRSFDNIFGAFPGANGVPAYGFPQQTDRDQANTVLPKLPMAWGGVTAPGVTPAITQTMSDNLPNKPYQIDSTYAGLDYAVVTNDLVHRFFQNQMQINGGSNDKYAAYSDVGGLVMGYYDGSKMALWKVAKQFVLADNFFQATFGGSFLNHQYLICGCAPEYPNADTAAAKPSISVVDKDGSGNFLPRLTLGNTSPASAIDGAPTWAGNGALAPKNYFGDGTFRAVNTMQPPYQPSYNAPATSDTTKLYADPAKGNTMPPQTATTVGDQLDAKGVTWKWYAGAWTATLTTATGDRTNFPQSSGPGVTPDFQFHHQPFNYYTKFDPQTGAAARTAHLKDYNDLVADATAGTLPQVVFYKPEGDLNEHPGYASLAVGDAHLADVVSKLQASPQWKNMVIVITYDENGGWWDHVAPPKGDQLGPGTRIPAIIISPFAKMGTVDHTQYDTASIVRLISRRFGLTPLPGIAARDSALKANGGQAMGDLTNALDL